MTIRFSKAEMQKAMKTVRTSVKNGKGQPKELKMKDMNGKTHTMTKKQYCGLFDNQVKFFMANSRYPNWVTYLYDTNTGFRGLEQPNSWTCGSQSLSNASSQVLCYATDKRCREACNTTTNGTSPSNLIKGAEKLGMKVEKKDTHIQLDADRIIAITLTPKEAAKLIESKWSVISNLKLIGKITQFLLLDLN